MTALIAEVSTEAADKGLTSLASGDYGVLGIILAIVLSILVVFGCFYVRSTQRALVEKDEIIESKSTAMRELAKEKDDMIATKDQEIKRLNEDRVTAAKTGTETVVKATESMAGVVPILQNITGQLQQLLARGG